MKILKTGAKHGFIYRLAKHTQPGFSLRRGEVRRDSGANYPIIKLDRHMFIVCGRYELALWWSKDLGPNPAHIEWRKEQDSQWLKNHLGKEVNLI